MRLVIDTPATLQTLQEQYSQLKFLPLIAAILQDSNGTHTEIEIHDLPGQRTYYLYPYQMLVALRNHHPETCALYSRILASRNRFKPGCYTILALPNL